MMRSNIGTSSEYCVLPRARRISPGKAEPSWDEDAMRRLQRRATGKLSILLGACVGLCAYSSFAGQSDGILKVCADPSNLPLSNDKGEGYENKIAEALAHDLKLRVEYTFFPQRIGFIRNTLRLKDEESQQYKCDLIIGVPKEYELTATTVPYMHSTYALIFAERSDLAGVHTAEDVLKLPRQKLDALRIGVFTKSPGSDWLLKNGMVDHAVSYSHQNGDVEESPAKTVERDLASDKIDGAILWGPIAGMLVQQRVQDPKWRAVPFEADPRIKFDYEIAERRKTMEGRARCLDFRTSGANRFDSAELQGSAGRCDRPRQFYR
jgi:quinoprotein dehydrogenase-associated probable ABC transporter substrate-binding protein